MEKPHARSNICGLRKKVDLRKGIKRCKRQIWYMQQKTNTKDALLSGLVIRTQILAQTFKVITYHQVLQKFDVLANQQANEATKFNIVLIRKNGEAPELCHLP
jgi:hypothetical protein